MKEEELKKIMQKSTLETSDDFINQLMHIIDAKEERKVSHWNSFRSVLIASSVLLVVITFIFYKLLQVQSSFLEIFSSIPKIPLFVMVTLSLLYFINSSIRLYERFRSH